MAREAGARETEAHRETFAVRPAAPEDAAAVASLFEESFGRPTTPEAVRWKLFDAPAALDAPPSFVAEAGGRVVGQYAGTPTRFLVRGEERTGLHGCDVMTAPAWRRRGVLTALGSAAHGAWRDAGVPFVTGLANAAWGSRAAALSWVEVFTVRWLVAPLRPGAVAARKLGVPALARLGPLESLARRAAALASPRDRSVSVDAPASAGEELDELWRAARGALSLSVVRDRAWVRWRYFAAPERGYTVLVARRGGRPVGLAAYALPEPGRAVLAELFAAPGDARARAELLRAATDDLVRRGAEVLSALAVPGSPAWRSCRRAGFLAGGTYRFELVPLDPALPLADLAAPEAWTLAGGDFDVA